jgi:hypothetical protein
MTRMADVSRAGAIGAAILILAVAAVTVSSGNSFAATHTSLAESGSSTT